MRALVLGLAASLLAASANAAVYFASRTVGAGTVDISITTDDTLGVLTKDNILDWTIVVANNGQSTEINSGNSNVFVDGTAFSATATGLFFDFGKAGSHSVTFVTGFRESYCVQTNGCFDFNGPAEFVTPGQFASNSVRAARSGVVELASTTAGVVPEPATWAMMLIGFAGAGAAIRTRRQHTAA